MAGTLTISTLSDGTNSTSSTNCIQGSAKAWVRFNGNTAVIGASYNVSSITRNAAGKYRVNMTNALVDTNYSAIVNGSVATLNNSFGASQMFCSAAATEVAPTTTAFEFIYYHTANGVYQDSNYFCVTVNR